MIHKSRRYEEVAGTVSEGDTIYVQGCWYWSEPTYIFEGINNLTLIGGSISNAILDPENNTVVQDVDGNDVVYSPAPWVATWTRDTGTGRIGAGKFRAFFEDVEDAKRKEEVDKIAAKQKLKEISKMASKAMEIKSFRQEPGNLNRKVLIQTGDTYYQYYWHMPEDTIAAEITGLYQELQNLVQNAQSATP